MSRVEEFHNVSISSSSVPRKLWSPFHRALALMTIFGMVFGGVLLAQPQSASAQSAATVTEDLNLRTEPNTSASIITVMKAGASVSLDGGSQNGFLSLSYNGNWGWAHADWITTGDYNPGSTPSGTGTAYVINGALNLRGGPSTSSSVITVMPDGAQVSLSGESSGGFLSVVYNGTSGWAFADYLSTSGAPTTPTNPSNPGVGDTVVGTMVTTDALNMRSGPGTGNGIITTIPNGATVEIMGDPQDGWYPVRYSGNKGWSIGTWLTSSGGETPTPTPPGPTNPGGVEIGDTVVGSRTVSTGLNLRTGPGTNYDVLVVMPGGVTVDVMGDAVSGFLPVQFHGTKGWASAEYLTTGSVPAPNPGNGDYSHDEIIQIIYASADKFGQPRADMLRVAQCESVLDPNALNPSSNASGLFQFLPGTWATTPYANQDIMDPVANSEAAAWMWANGRRNEWVCQ